MALDRRLLRLGGADPLFDSADAILQRGNIRFEIFRQASNVSCCEEIIDWTSGSFRRAIKSRGKVTCGSSRISATKRDFMASERI